MLRYFMCISFSFIFFLYIYIFLARRPFQSVSGCVLLQDYLGGIIVFVAIITALLTASVYPHTTAPSLVGLAINYTLLVPIYLNWVVKLLSDMEMYIGAVERVSHYIEGEQQQPNVAAGSHHKEKCKSYILPGPFGTRLIHSCSLSPPPLSTFTPCSRTRSFCSFSRYGPVFACSSAVYQCVVCSVLFGYFILFYFICDLTMISISTEMGIEIGLWIEGAADHLCQCCPSVHACICVLYNVICYMCI